MPKIKICGITNLADARLCAKEGADLLGFIFYKKSPRYVAPQKACRIIEKLKHSVLKVGVFVNEDADRVKRIARACSLDFLQFHGDETPRYLAGFKNYKVIKAFRVKDRSSLKGFSRCRAGYFLFDAFKKDVFGGTGAAFDWRLLKLLKKSPKPFFISGGLTSKNVQELLGLIKPFAVDVSSGVERSPGKKDGLLVRKFIKNVKEA